MNRELTVRSAAREPEARRRVAEFLEAGGWSLLGEPGAEGPWRRGSRGARHFSPAIERWPTRLDVSVHAVAPDEVAVRLHYAVATGLRLCGALDLAILEAEAALLQDYLETGVRRDLASAVAPLRRPALTAAALNMGLAAAVVGFVGNLGGYPPAGVVAVAVAVALLDGLVIRSFADLLVSGASQVPRLDPRRPRRPPVTPPAGSTGAERPTAVAP